MQLMSPFSGRKMKDQGHICPLNFRIGDAISDDKSLALLSKTAVVRLWNLLNAEQNSRAKLMLAFTRLCNGKACGYCYATDFTT